MNHGIIYVKNIIKGKKYFETLKSLANTLIKEQIESDSQISKSISFHSWVVEGKKDPSYTRP